MGIEEATEKQEGRAAYCPPTVDDAPSLFSNIISSASSPTAEMNAFTTLFDECLPLTMQVVIDELSGLAQQDREAGGDPSQHSGAGGASGDGTGITTKKSVKEAKGNKAPEILELIAKNLLFRPTYHTRAYFPSHRHVTAFEFREMKRRAREAETETEDDSGRLTDDNALSL